MKNQLMNKILFIIFFCISMIFADSTTLSLKDVLTRAMENNPIVRIEMINTNIAETYLKENRYMYEPNISAQYLTNVKPQNFGETNQVFLGINQKAPTGTSVDFTINNVHSNTGSTINASRLTITQALLQGLRMSANLVPIHKAKIDMELRQEELAGVAGRLLMDAERAYWNLFLSGEEVKIYEYSLGLANRLLFEADARLQTGSIAPIDLAIIKAEVASREKQLFDAQTSYKQNILALAYIMNAPEFWTADIVLSDTISSLGEADVLSDHIKAAQKFRPDFRQAELQAKKGELTLAQTKNGLLPKLDFFIYLQGSSYSESFTLFPNDMAQQISMGLNLNFPLTNGAARQRNQQAKYTLEQQNLSIENFSRLLEYEIRSAVMEVSRAAIQIETARIVGELQKQKMEAEQEKMNVGRSTGFAVLQAQRDLVSANLDEARAKAAYSDALLSLYFRDGTLLQRRGIKPLD